MVLPDLGTIARSTRLIIPYKVAVYPLLPGGDDRHLGLRMPHDLAYIRDIKIMLVNKK
jgi:hypothetical protein